jgi:L-2-hydroxyglutarate oxidase LhgO
MKFFEADSINNGCTIAYNSEVIAIEKSSSGYIVNLKNPSGDTFEIESELVINSAGLHCGKVAAIAGFDNEKCGYVIKYSKGIYYRVKRQLERYPKALVYPVHPVNNIIGIHTVPDTAGGMRLGPHFFPVNEIEYSIDYSFHDLFYTNAKSYLPFLEPEDISPDMAGVHPYLYNPCNPSQDFIIKEESDKGFPGFINLINIGSPGLTAAPAIGKMVGKMVKNISFIFNNSK